jgi:hypothetical protein
VKIHKGTIPLKRGIHTILLPINLDIIDVQERHGHVAIWYIYSSTQFAHWFKVVFTGEEFDEECVHLKTIQHKDLVYHVYKVWHQKTT